MGCGYSRIDTDLTKFCRERKHFIKASRDSLSSLSHLHKEYLESLQNVDNEIRDFVGEALVVCFNSPLENVRVHQNGEVISQSKDSRSDSDEDDVISLTHFVHGGSDLSDEDDVSVTHFVHGGSDLSDEDVVSVTHFVHGGSDLSDDVLSLTDFVHGGVDLLDTENERSSEEVSAGVFVQHSVPHMPSFPGIFEFPQTANGGGFFASSGSGFPDRNYPFYNNAVHSIPSTSAITDYENWESSHQQRNFYFHSQTYDSVPSDFSYPDTSKWDYLSIFTSAEKDFPNLYFQGQYDTHFRYNDYDFSEVRKAEGIPDLEDENTSSGEKDVERNGKEENNLSEEAPDKSKDVCPDNAVIKNKGHEIQSSSCPSERDQINDVIKKKVDESSSSCPSESVKLKKNDREHEVSKLDELAKEEAHETDVTEQELTSCSSDLQKVLGYIHDAFDTMIIHGKDISEILDPYQPSVTLSKRASSFGISVLRRLMFKRRVYRKLKYDQGEETSTTPCSLLWILEKLCLWEKKLYDEVKEEEKLREMFDKEWLRLKKLDRRGAEPSRIEACQSSLNRLTPRLNVAMSRIEGIARATYQISTDELQPQLCEFIRRLHKMAKLSYEAHRKQVQAISRCNANIDTITCTASSSSQTVTEKLEAGFKRLERIILCWISSHKAFVFDLNNWLAKLQEQKEVSGLNSSSPISILTPDAFRMCSELLSALEKVSEAEVSVHFENFSLTLHQLKENLREEEHHRLRLQYLSKYLEKKVRRLCMDYGFDWDQYGMFFKEGDLTEAVSGNPTLDGLYANLRPVRDKLQEAAASHEVAVKQLNDVASGVFGKGLIPALQALESYNLEMCKAYEQVRIPN